MKTIYILRHAKAEDGKEGQSDKERKLVKKGIEDSKLIAKSLSVEGEIPDVIISSDAPRAFETAKIFAKKVKYKTAEIVLNQKLYTLTTVPPVLKIIQEMDNACKSVMIVGHDPLLSSLASYLVKSFTFDLPKTSVLKIECPARRWSDIAPGKNNVALFLTPMNKKKIDKMNRLLTKRLSDTLETLIFNAVKRAEPGKAAKARKMISKRSGQIADNIIKKRKHLPLRTIEDIGLVLNPEGTETENTSKS